MTNARIYEVANGKAIIEYYTPDSTAPEDITIEGVDKKWKGMPDHTDNR